MNRLRGRKALITGGSSGIGLATAAAFVREGAQVVLTGRNSDALKTACDGLGDASSWIVNDAVDIAAQELLAQEIERRLGRVDLVFLNAADVTHAPVEQWTEAEFDRVLDTNLKGPFFLLQALLPLFANPSSVILCGSVSAHIGLPQSSVYAASKAGLLSLARTLSGEWKARGIRVNGLSPGPTQTPALNKLGLPEAEHRKLLSEIEALVPIGRMGTPEEIANAVVFLASDESSFVVGAGLLVDGGVASL